MVGGGGGGGDKNSPLSDKNVTCAFYSGRRLLRFSHFRFTSPFTTKQPLSDIFEEITFF